MFVYVCMCVCVYNMHLYVCVRPMLTCMYIVYKAEVDTGCLFLLFLILFSSTVVSH